MAQKLNSNRGATYQNEAKDMENEQGYLMGRLM
jgi:hypothetical protein